MLLCKVAFAHCLSSLMRIVAVEVNVSVAATGAVTGHRIPHVTPLSAVYAAG